ncbi:unnamed protein product [Pleuronectes platessa]|uniref:Uncharacterized protein n=1 Tax=Pleuronectes platessa TaxID=8262 RepID=A0A9N7Z9M3_PLEPL|nr:unnamed protein product [Pleuronectes platessa]
MPVCSSPAPPQPALEEADVFDSDTVCPISSEYKKAECPPAAISDQTAETDTGSDWMVNIMEHFAVTIYRQSLGDTPARAEGEGRKRGGRQRVRENEELKRGGGKEAPFHFLPLPHMVPKPRCFQPLVLPFNVPARTPRRAPRSRASSPLTEATLQHHSPQVMLLLHEPSAQPPSSASTE